MCEREAWMRMNGNARQAAVDKWQKIVWKAVESANHGDGETLALLAQRLAECDAAQEALRAKGYGETGAPLGEMVKLVPDTFALESLCESLGDR